MADHEAYMRRALELASRGRGIASPNPMVGAVVVRDDEIVGEGWHEGRGRPHAEVIALGAARGRVRGATVYTTLEPCSHYGHTPPCARALIEAGVARAVVAARDPNPIVDGRGLEALRSAGIHVETGVLEAEARRLNEAFERYVVTGLPFVVLKMASTLDGKTAARDGSSKWITGEPARADVQRLRSWSDAVVVGARTALVDDPSLTVRDETLRGRPPLRVLVDATGAVPPTGKFFDRSAPTLVATTDVSEGKRRDAWLGAGAEVVTLESDPYGGVSLGDLLAHLGKREIQTVLVEGGSTLAWSFVREGLVDKMVLYLAPLLAGGVEAPGVLAGEGFAPIAAARRLELFSAERIGEDLRVEAYVHGDR